MESATFWRIKAGWISQPRTLAAVLVLLFAATTWGQANRVPVLEGVGIDQKVGGQIPSDILLHDEHGRDLHWADLSDGKPVLLALVYYNCPMLCTVTLNELLRSLQALPLQMDQQYRVVTVSFDPREKSELAAHKKQSYIQAYGRSGGEAGWRFLTGEEPQLHRLTEAVGFHYVWDSLSQQFIHPSALVVLTPEGRIARYFFGVDYEALDLRLALLEAAGGRVGSVTDKVLLFCYRYDAATGRYTLAVLRTLKLAAAVTLALVAVGWWWLWRQDRRRTRALLPQADRAASHRRPP